MKLYKQKNGKTWSMRFVFEGQRIEQSTGHTNLRRAEAFAEAFRTNPWVQKSNGGLPRVV